MEYSRHQGLNLDRTLISPQVAHAGAVIELLLIDEW